MKLVMQLHASQCVHAGDVCSDRFHSVVDSKRDSLPCGGGHRKFLLRRDVDSVGRYCGMPVSLKAKAACTLRPACSPVHSTFFIKAIRSCKHTYMLSSAPLQH